MSFLLPYPALANAELLNDLAKRFLANDKDLTVYGFPSPPDLGSELERERAKHCVNENQTILDRLLETHPHADANQESFYNEITTAIRDKETKLFFLQGPAGCGKSTFAKKIQAFTRSLGKICLGCSSTALSTQVYDDFDTAHSLFCLVVVEDLDDYEHENEIMCRFHLKKGRFELLMAADVIIWDEALNNHKHCFMSAYSQLNRFEGKVMLLMGDWRQIAPVVVKGRKEQVLQAHLCNANIFNEKFLQREFSKNLRLRADQVAYNKMLQDLGNYTFDSDEVMFEDSIDADNGHCRIWLPNVAVETNIDSALQFLFPEGFDSDMMREKAILATTNNRVDEWNTRVQDLNMGEERTFLSTDTFCDFDDSNRYLQHMLSDQILNAFNSPGVPKHIIKFKVGDICILLRNISKGDKLHNNTRVKIIALSQFRIRVQTLDLSHPMSFSLSRIRFKFRFARGYQMMRTQFPLRLAYCMSINKSQGQGFEALLIDTRDPAFSHGHTYVAFSRIYDACKLKVFCDMDGLYDRTDQSQGAVIQNIVFPELKNKFYRSEQQQDILDEDHNIEMNPNAHDN